MSKRVNTIKVLDITVDRGVTYHVCGVYTSVRKAKQAVEAFIEGYNSVRDEKKGEVCFEHKDELWIHTETDELVFPFGPGAEYRIRQLVPNKAIAIKD